MEITLAVLATIGVVMAGAGPHIVQLFRSRKAGVKDDDVQAAPASAPPPPDPVEGFDRLVERLEWRSARLERRLDYMEAWNVIQGDHIDLLENHIWLNKPPPPPPRPRYTPYVDPEDTPKE